MKSIEFGQAVVVLANLGVIAGIVFLGFELSQTGVTLRDSSHLSSLQLSHDSLDRFWESDFVAIYQAGMKDLYSLSPEERSQFEAYVWQRFNLIGVLQWTKRFGSGGTLIFRTNCKQKLGKQYGNLCARHTVRAS